MKILHTGDWHIGSFNGPTKNGENLRFLDICKCLDKLVEDAKSIQPDAIIVAGDVFHQARVWSDRGLKESQTAIGYIRELEKVAPVVVLRGTPNHDSAEQFNSLCTAFENDGNVHIVTEPKVVSIYTGRWGWLHVACLPGFDRGYFRAKMPGLDKMEENEIFTQHIDILIKGLKAQCPADAPNVLVTHYTVEGANMESGQTAFFSQYEPCVYLPTLQAAGFDLCCFGHIHRPQQLDGCRNAFYCGAVSALNFNDEGQPRGYYVHEIEHGGDAKSEFFNLPTRQFKTVRLVDDDVREINENGAEWLYKLPVLEDADAVRDAIVRVLYDCTDEHNKALNKTALEQWLYEVGGAFWVQEITPEKITITVSKNALKDDDSPEENLRAYLSEKEIPETDAGRIMGRAIPIISEAVEASLTAKKTGAFVPVEMEVHNYRNYRDETFSFDGIRFCTINGENGAGKSSLFMDAMCDCLFEETREGDISGWISNAEDARSGSIKFTFRIGDSTYRVTRTRMKSGKATLNLSELVDGEWTDRSCEKIRDTQAEILNTIGMDSLTLKATGLIMQDQYGLFLTADKDARMTILGNILGLSMYDDMYGRAFNRATEVNREIRSTKDKITVLLGGTPELDTIDRMISEKQTELAQVEEKRKKAADTADSMKLALSMYEDAAERVVKLNSQIMATNAKKASAQANITAQQSIILVSNGVLAKSVEIAQGVAAYHEAQEQEKGLLTAKTKYDAATAALEDAKAQLAAEAEAVAEMERKRGAMRLAKLIPAQEILKRESELKALHEEYEATRAMLDDMEAARAGYDAAMDAVRAAEAAAEKARRDGEAGTRERNTAIANLRRRAELLEANNCPYADEVKCSFLKDALEAKGQIDEALREFDQYQATAIAAVEAADAALLAAKEVVPSSYSPEREKELRGVLRGLEASEKQYAELSVARADLKNAEEMIADYDKRIEDGRKKVQEADEAVKRATAELYSLTEAMDSYNAVMERITSLAHFLEDEKQLPVAAERKKAAEVRIAELTASVTEYEISVAEMEKEKAEQEAKTVGGDVLLRQYEEAGREVTRLDGEIQSLNRNIGTAQQMKAEAEAKRNQAAEMMEHVEELSVQAADLEILKTAFSQDGIPHNIVRSIIPIFEATATNILGQMSGGHMSVEFVMEKTLKSNSKKEVTALDIIINDSQTGRLPYMSRSGGERVKSALAVILALAEIKSTKAGVQLGFLFIDEPPFLDAAGVTAYCDALEAIQSRYSDLKVMAITHDPTMKARFPQSIDVVKTAEGSKVIYS